MMESYPPFTDIHHAVPMMSGNPHHHQTYDAHDHSLPSDHPFVTRASQFQFHLSPFEQAKSAEILTPQPWWKTENQHFGMGYFPPEFSSYTEGISPWNSEISTISDPQSPRSSNSGSVPGMNCIASPGYRQDEITISTVDESTGYPAPNGLVEIDPSMVLPGTQPFDVPLDHRPPFEADFDPWSGSQSDRNVTPEQQWPSPLPSDPMAFPQPQSQIRRSKGRPAGPTSASKGIRKSTSERRPTSAPGRNRRRRGAASNTGSGSTPRTFVCSFAPYGCESTFVSKNEWKRHVTSQHLQLGFYRCDVGKCSVHHAHSTSTSSSPVPHSRTNSNTPTPGQPNDFNRKDLFTQHQRRMHAPWLQSGRRRAPEDAEHAAFEASLEEVRQRCWVGLRTPPLQSHCGFCNEVFSGEGSWDVRMEHIGRHFEREDREALGDEVEDLALQEWGLNEGILTLVDGKCRLASLVGVGL
ncbi:hypothetical protein N7456_013355 [Penicillium angulare]|uniref:Zinc finger, C2H2 n=1 Tax=Penicillium angulare TaxID=116970 RepID=A0A9W9EFZ0_9EURO|nr:hypothetical protein N7456_013355 [Penicillium angulare]